MNRLVLIDPDVWIGALGPRPGKWGEGDGSTDEWVLALWVEKSQAHIELHPGSWIMAEPDGIDFYPCIDEVLQARWELDDVTDSQ